MWKYILIRMFFALFPLGILASLVINPDTQSGNNGMGSHLISLILALLGLTGWGVYILIEGIRFFIKYEYEKTIINSILLILIVGTYILLLYFEHEGGI